MRLLFLFVEFLRAWEQVTLIRNCLQALFLALLLPLDTASTFPLASNAVGAQCPHSAVYDLVDKTVIAESFAGDFLGDSGCFSL